MRTVSPLAYVPRRATLQSAGLGPVSLYLGSFLVVGFFSGDPLVLAAAAAGAAIAGYGCGAGRAVRFSLRLGAALAAAMIVINGLVTSRGSTVLLRLGEWPVFGRIDVTLESLAAGAVIGLRALATMVVIGVWSACVDPDRVLRAVSGVARRSALTATLISRLVPLAASDYSRLGEASGLRGPAATPVGRAAMANRLLGGSLDRAVDVAATLELRGYGRGVPARDSTAARSRFDRRFLLAGAVLAGLALLTLLPGGSAFSTYPTIEYRPGVLTWVTAVSFIAAGFVTWRGGPGSRG
jgi:energy-coupling factor transport system permease protein